MADRGFVQNVVSNNIFRKWTLLDIRRKLYKVIYNCNLDGGINELGRTLVRHFREPKGRKTGASTGQTNIAAAQNIR